MFNNDNDGWEDVNDAVEIKALLGVKGVRDASKASPAKAGLPTAPVDLDSPAKPPTGQSAQAAYTKVSASRTMLQQLNKVRRMYEQKMAKGGLAGLREYNPLDKTNQQFDGAVSAIPLLARQAFRVAGSGADTEGELKLIMDALPNRWSFDATNSERFKTLDTVLRTFIRTNGGLAGYSPEQIKALAEENPYGAKRLPKAPPKATPKRPDAAAALRAKYGLR